ncbi:leucyl aminopeptidase family protein, partial [Francisellaceae bacterium]|nr:leucyl aminopeptidase family protein [Francisellaceae bacterium]
PSLYIKFLKKLAAKQNWGYEFYSKKKLASLKANAFLAVARASHEAGIVHLKYKPESNTNGKRLALVGKGVCYDTGGINVKPDQYMFGMQEDMQGSSVALGTFYMLTQLQVPYEIDCWLAITENNISADCYTPNEVVTASNGLTIEVVHTDAEGRMILADTLVLASKKKPDLLIDYATLTGASIKAVGKKYASVFTTDFDLNSKLIKAGQQSGERVWPFPMTDDYDENIKSDIADIQQCNLQGGPDHIDAARFLSKFVGDSIKWVHVDLAAAMDNKGGLGAIPTASTGFGVWFTKEFLDDYFNAKV